MASVLVEMYRSKGNLTEYGKNGQRMALNQFSWRIDAKRLVDIYKKIETENGKKLA
jgi:hypothetical protein